MTKIKDLSLLMNSKIINQRKWQQILDFLFQKLFQRSQKVIGLLSDKVLVMKMIIIFKYNLTNRVILLTKRQVIKFKFNAKSKLINKKKSNNLNIQNNKQLTRFRAQSRQILMDRPNNFYRQLMKSRYKTKQLCSKYKNQ